MDRQVEMKEADTVEVLQAIRMVERSQSVSGITDLGTRCLDLKILIRQRR